MSAGSKAKKSGVGRPGKVVRDGAVFSAHHPLIPKLYVPAWQQDMENRKLIIQVHACS